MARSLGRGAESRTNSAGRGGFLNLLDKAKAVIGDRQRQYGPPTDHHKATAQMWTVLLRRKLAVGASIEAADVGLLYAADKLVRESYLPLEDNRLDVCGYMACREAILTSTERSELDEAQEAGILRRAS